MVGQPGLFYLSDRYEALSVASDPLERLSAVIDFEVFRGPLILTLRHMLTARPSCRSKNLCKLSQISQMPPG